MQAKKRLLTGLKPSGSIHIGNYYGALKPFLDKSADFDSYIMVADYHALISVRDRETLQKSIFDIVRAYLAVGLDPEKVTVFRQSDNQDHMELGWVLNCMVTVPFLMQAHAYKDNVAKGMEANAGLFTYPMLQAADIALYDTDVVPVGEDQRQHLEYAREAVNKFNNAYGQTLKEPAELILEGVGVVPGTDGQKMSKSYKNTIPLFGTKEEVEKAVMSIVTDSSGEHPENVYAIHRLLKSAEGLDPIYEANKGRYGDLKKILISDLEVLIAPMREKYNSISDDEIRNVLEKGVEKAKKISNETIQKVRGAIGISI